MPDSPVFTSQDLAERYHVPAWTIRLLIDRLGLGRRLGRWRIITTSADLDKLEAGLQALGHKIPEKPLVAANEQSKK
jgi:hypothetical protein